MKIGIFSRLTVCYLIVIVLLSASNIFAILKLMQLNTIVTNSNNMDMFLIDSTKRIADLIRSERINEQKYFLTKNPAAYNMYLSAKGEFEKVLEKLSSMPLSTSRKISLEKVIKHHRDYQLLVQAEVQHMKENLPYDRNWYSSMKERAVDAIDEEEENLEDYSRDDINQKIQTISKAGTSARSVVVLFLLLSVLLAVLLSFFITQSITSPLMNLVKKARSIEAGEFECSLAVPGLPEINELTEAFNLMCEKLKAMDKLKNDFFSMMSHELRTPLTSIKEGASLLLDGVGGTITEKQGRLLRIINTESKRMTILVNSILDLSKMEVGMMPYNFEQNSINPLIKRIMSEFEPNVEAKSILLETQIHEDLKSTMFDGERILDVLRNLVANAVKFTPEGGRISIAARPVPGGVEVSVSDTGPGIPQENLAGMFDKFVSSDQKMGTGLGLAVVKHIISAHRGTVWVESKIGEGSCFYFTLKREEMHTI